MADCRRCGRWIRLGNCCSALECLFGKLLFRLTRWEH
jgi:hypothetical protein